MTIPAPRLDVPAANDVTIGEVYRLTVALSGSVGTLAAQLSEFMAASRRDAEQRDLRLHETFLTRERADHLSERCADDRADLTTEIAALKAANVARDERAERVHAARKKDRQWAIGIVAGLVSLEGVQQVLQLVQK